MDNGKKSEVDLFRDLITALTIKVLSSLGMSYPRDRSIG
jgi:hypothetical protein